MSISDFAEQPDKANQAAQSKPSDFSTAPTAPAEAPSTPAPTVSEPPAGPPAPPSADEIVNSILSKINPIGQQAYLKLMIVGEPGSTKSSFTATASNNLIVDFEQGLVSAKHSPNGVGEGTQAFPYSTFEEFTNLIKLVKSRNPALDSFEVFSVDTLSDLHKRGLSEINEREWRKRPSSVNRYVPEVEHHTENNEKILRVLRHLRDLDRHIIITSHSKTVEPRNKPAKTYADFSESLSNKVMAMMDIVGYMSMKKVDGTMVPVMRVVTDGTIACKTRIPLPEEIINPTFPQILKAWNKAMNT